MRKARYAKQLTISLSAEEYDRIKAVTDRKHISMAEYIRDVLDASCPTSTVESK